MKKYVQYGCGLSAPEEWTNFDASPTLRIQKTPLLGFLLSKNLNAHFPKNVKYGDIVKGLPIPDNSCDGIYCSHVLEHLSYEDFTIALKNTYKILRPGGIFRLVMPDFGYMVDSYLANRGKGDREASITFMKKSGLALKTRPRGVKALLQSAFGNSGHRWLWDTNATIVELEKVGFRDIRKFEFNNSEDQMFTLVEDEGRFQGALALEMTK